MDVAKAMLVVLAANAVLSAVKVGLDSLAKLFPSLQGADNAVGSVYAVVQKVVDFLSANVPH